MSISTNKRRIFKRICAHD